MENNQKMMPIGQLISQSFKVYENKFWPMIRMAALPYLGILLVFLLSALMGSLYTFLANFGYLGTTVAVVLIILAIIAIVIAFIFSYVAQVAIMYFVRDKKDNLSIIGALKKAKPIALQFFALSLLVGAIVMLWSLLFIIPGVIMSVYYIFAAWVLIIEKKTGMDAIRRSKELVRGSWRAVFGRYFLVMILMWLVIAVPGFFIAKETTSEGIYSLLSNIFSLVATPFMIAYSYNMYRDLVRMKSTPTQI